MLSSCDTGDTPRESDNGAELQRAQLPTEIILMGVRWYLAYPLSTRHVEELRLELSSPQIIYTLKFATEPDRTTPRAIRCVLDCA